MENLEDGLRKKKPTKTVLRPFEMRDIKIDEDIENIVGDIALMNVLGIDGELLEDLRKYLSSLADSGKEITYDKISLWIKKEKIKLKMNQCEKPQAWYEILISDCFIKYVKSNPDYETDFEIENSVINQFWSVVDGLSCGSSMRIIGNYGEDYLPDYGEWFLRGALAYLKDEYNEKDTRVIAKSIREIDERNVLSDHDPNILSEVQLAFLIMWITWNRPSHECMLYEFTISGGLKKYLLALRKRHEATTQNES